MLFPYFFIDIFPLGLFGSPKNFAEIQLLPKIYLIASTLNHFTILRTFNLIKTGKVILKLVIYYVIPVADYITHLLN